MALSIHPTAIIERSVKIGKRVKIGPYCVLTEQVELDDDVELISHVTLAGRTRIGKGTKIYPFSSIGHPTQDLKYKGEPSTLTIGEYNLIREYVTIQAGTAGGIMKTEIGNHCLLMASTHVAHDCILGDHIVMANNATLAGHVVVEDHAIIGGLSAVHQFVRIGKHVIIGGMSAVEHDVIPYGAVKGERANLYGLNLIGLKRRGLSRKEIESLREAYKDLFSQGNTLAHRVQRTAEKFKNDRRVMEIIDFIKAESTRSLCTPKGHETL
jgi:UDP-N-acetylglucosamine acyltransferase